jgi:hypothetical protein
MYNTCFNCWSDELEDLGRFGIRQETYMEIPFEDGSIAHVNVSFGELYQLVLCRECIMYPDLIEPSIVQAYINYHGELFHEYAEVVTGALEACLEKGVNVLERVNLKEVQATIFKHADNDDFPIYAPIDSKEHDKTFLKYVIVPLIENDDSVVFTQ